MGQTFVKSLERGSSPVDWCEPNYVRSPLIAEYWNTMSNVLFIALPVAMLFLFRPYGSNVGPGMHVTLPLLIFIGLSSMYFHSTLSFAGQMLDELSIFWTLCAAFATFLPRKYFPIIRGNRKILSCATAVFCTMLTGLLLLQPYLNSFVLMFSVVPVMILIYKDSKRDERLHRLSLRAILTCTLAVIVWSLDRMFCNTWLYLGFPYLHAVWHVLIAVPACSAFVVGAYVQIREDRPGLKPALKYWPIGDLEVGVPYVSVESDS